MHRIIFWLDFSSKIPEVIIIFIFDNFVKEMLICGKMLIFIVVNEKSALT